MDQTFETCICPACAKPAALAQPHCDSCKSPLLLNGRYRLIRVLGQNTGVTWLALDEQTNVQVVVKELSVRKISAWKEHELFHREMSVLKQLSHPGIPGFLDDFTRSQARKESFYFVQEHREGKNLKEEMESHRYTEHEVLLVVGQVLEILVYLQGLSPAVIHRDIKPSNIIRSGSGRVSLIDFGSVADLVRPGNQGSTVAGTFGYMAPEQLYGKSAPGTDVYGLGITAVVLLTRKDPEEMLDERNVLSWQSHGQFSRPIADLLGRMLAGPVAERPMAPAVLEMVNAVLEGKTLSSSRVQFLGCEPGVIDNVSYPVFSRNRDRAASAKSQQDQAIDSWKKRPGIRQNGEYVAAEKRFNAGIIGVAIAALILVFTFFILGKVSDSQDGSSASVVEERQQRAGGVFLAPRDFLFPCRQQQDGGPAARSRVAGACAVCVDGNCVHAGDSTGNVVLGQD